MIWIGVRPSRKAPMNVLRTATLGLTGLEGDHARAGKRSVTLIQDEHLGVIAALTGTAVTPINLRRNIVVAGINLLALRNRDVSIGGALVRITGIAAPCSRMEEILGEGGYNAMRGHGGVTGQVIAAGDITVGDDIAPIAD